jgi:uncharacterized caspase-like protein
VIAVKDYVSGTPLRFTKNDAYAFRNALLRIGFKPENIRVLTCPQKPELGEPAVASRDLAIKSNMETVIQEVLYRANKGDLVIIFLTGHGLELNGQPYFEPLDSRGGSVASLQASTVSIGKIFADFGQCEASVKLLSVDACRSVPSWGNQRGVVPLNQLANPPRVSYSCKAARAARPVSKWMEYWGECLV